MKFVILITFSGLIFWCTLEMCTSNLNVDELKKNESVELVRVPNSTFIQKFAEALYLNLHEEVPFVKSFPSKKRNAVDVCELTKKDAMVYCQKLEKMYELVTDGNYSFVPGKQVEACKMYTAALYHISFPPTRTSVRARKCPFEPDELFITTGNKRIPVFVLTWVNTDKKYVHLDHYIPADDINDTDKIKEDLKRLRAQNKATENSLSTVTSE